jgi:hypothetical protein
MKSKLSNASKLQVAREHLARAEAGYSSDDALFHLEEGLMLLDEIIEADVGAERTVARNLASTYASKIYSRVQTALDTERGIPEPVLEHFFKLMLAFDEGDFELPAQARSLKIAVARNLIDRYFEGHSPADKQKILQQFGEITGE